MPGTEEEFVQFILETKHQNLPSEVVNTVKHLFLTIIGTTIAGATLEGCEALRDQIREWGGTQEATILLYGDKVPAHHAALVNSYMARALDFDDGIRPGMHVGASAVPAGLAASELAKGCSGKEFLTALVVGAEVADRINLVSDYDGFDPTGICSIFAATAVASRILRLNKDQTWDALAIAFNKSGGSFQSNIEGALSVRLIQGFVAQGGILSAQLAKKGFTGPKHFLEGIYGYFHLYAKDRYDPLAVSGELGRRFEFNKTMFKKFPSCGDTISSTEAMLDLVREYEITPNNVSQINVKVTPYAFKLVGGPFKIGDNPRVNAQFNIRYCVANALLRRNSQLEHFEEPFIRDPKLMDIIPKIHVEADPILNERDETAVEMEVLTKSGDKYNKRIDFAAGFAERPLTREEIMERFWNCLDYARRPLSREKGEKLVSLISKLERLEDIRSLIPLVLW
ncbi:MAG: MmgE/PrpD family protein [Syntrophaceae bacterium]|nr:MmgE/PrpD family protein [Syntrophaceae bacterium]